LDRNFTFQIIFMVWTTISGLMDLKEQRVHWLWSLLGLITASAWRVFCWKQKGFEAFEALLITLVIISAYQLWRFKIWGGADAKVFIVLIVAIPQVYLLAILGLAMGLVPWLLNFYYRLYLRVSGHSSTAQLQRAWWRQKIPLVALLSVATWFYLALDLFCRH